VINTKNPHAVALGRLGGTKGGPARAKALSARRRSQIATRAATARARSMTAAERRELARRAAAARWSRPAPIRTARDAPAYVARLLAQYDQAALHWRRRNHRYIIVREVLLRGDDRAVRWLRWMMTSRAIRDLVCAHRGAGCSERDRRKLRRVLRLTLVDLPPEPVDLVKARAPSAPFLI
jgi:hypothetical protein